MAANKRTWAQGKRIRPMKKIVFTLILALQFTAATQVAIADVDIPVCYPCEGGK
jgi:hypothetical protein